MWCEVVDRAWELHYTAAVVFVAKASLPVMDCLRHRIAPSEVILCQRHV